MRKWGGNFLEHQLCQNFKLWQSAYRKSDVLGSVRRIRKETEKFGRGEGGFLMKKGFEKGEVSL